MAPRVRQGLALNFAVDNPGTLGRVDSEVVERRGGAALSPEDQEQRRSFPGDEIIVDCVEVPVAEGRAPVLAVKNELLVRRDDVDRARAIVAATHPDCAPVEVDELDGLLWRLDFPTRVSISELTTLAAEIRGQGVQASVSHVPPLRIVIKGECGPEPVMPHGARPGGEIADQHPHVAVVDCGIRGIVAEERDDGWLDGIDDPDVPGRARDPLDAFPIPGGNGLLDLAAGHGTFVAGVVRQVAPRAKVSMLRALDSDGVGSEVAIAQAMVRAARAGADIINLSLGVQTLDDQPLLAIEVALEIIHHAFSEVVVVAAAGNYGNRRPCFPAAQQGVVAVAAVKRDGTLARWSSRGYWVDCAAVGEDVESTFVAGTEDSQVGAADPTPDTWQWPNPWARWSGTSFAAPQVAGAVAGLMIEDTTLTAPAALDRLLGGGRPSPNLGRVVHIPL